MLAAVTTLPVVGVPVPLAYLDGMDSLLSIVQMPAGVPVATVSDRAERATPGCSRCASSRPARATQADRLRTAMAAFQEDLQGQADGKGERLRAQTTSARPSVGFSV